MQSADAYRSPSCVASLVALDPWWKEMTCTGQTTTEEDGNAPDASASGAQPPAASGASSTNGATSAANPSADDGGGCSTAGTDPSAATVQILLALVGAIAVRRGIRGRVSG